MATALTTAFLRGVHFEDNRGPEIVRAVSVVAVLATLASNLRKLPLILSHVDRHLLLAVRVGLGRHIEVLSTRKHEELKIVSDLSRLTRVLIALSFSSPRRSSTLSHSLQ